MASWNEGFEDGDVSEWSSSTHWGATSTVSHSGTYAGALETGGTHVGEPESSIAPSDLNGGVEIVEFEFYWQETSDSSGGGLALLNPSGDEILAFGSNNPQWMVLDASGENELYSGDGYDRWIRVRVYNIDWTAATADVEFEDMQSGTLRSGTFDLMATGGVESIGVGSYFTQNQTVLYVDDLAADDGTPDPPTNLTAAASGTTIDHSWTDNSTDEDGFNIYRAESSGTSLSDYTQIDSVGADETTYTDSGLQEGVEYFYRVTAYSSSESAPSNEDAATTNLPAPSAFSIDAVNGDQFDVSWTDNSTDEDGFRIEVSHDDSGWVEDGTVPADTTTYTTTSLLDGEEYDVRAVAFTSDAESASSPDTATTVLPDLNQIDTLDNGIEDEVTVHWTDVIDNGEYEVQYRETGASTWDSMSVDGANSSAAVTGLNDGAEYEFRVRTTTEHRTGEWTPAETIVTKFPTPTDLSVVETGMATLTLAWTDQADNEDGFRVYRQQEYDSGWTNWEHLDTVAPLDGTGTVEYTDSTVSPGDTYNYYVEAFTDDATNTSAETGPVTTVSSGRPRTRTGSRGWHVEVDHPDGSTLRPSVASDDVEWRPVLNGLPRVDLPVPRNSKWESDALDGADMRVWKDGHRLPIDQLQSTTREPGQDILHGVGGLELDDYLESVQFDERESHLAAQDVIKDDVGVAADVDDPASNTRNDVRMQSGDQTSAFEDDLDDPSTPFADDQPLNLINGQVRTEQTGWFQESEAATTNAPTFFADEEGNPGAWSEGGAIRLRDLSEEIEFTFNTDHVIPSGEGVVEMVFSNPDVNPELNVYIQPSGQPEEQVTQLPEDSLAAGADKFDLRAFDFDINEDDSLGEGTHTFRVEVNSSVDEGIFVDFFHARDDRYSITQDTNPDGGVVEGWEQHPEAFDLVFESVSSVEQVVGGSADIDINNTEGSQALAVRNGTNDWQEAQNADSLSVEEFASAEQSIQLRVTLSRYDSGSASGQNGDQPQILDAYELRASLDDTPVILDKAYSGTGTSILNRIAESGDFVWEVRREDGETVVVWTQPGQRTTDRQPDFVDYSGRRTVEESYQRVIVEGASRQVEDEQVSVSGYDQLEAVDEAHVQTGSETVYDVGDPDTVYDRGVDYAMDWHLGAIELLSDGSMDTDTEYAIDYSWKIRGEYQLPDATDPRTREVQVPEASTEREADQYARGLVKELQDPLEEVTATITGADPSWSLVEALASDDLPFSGPLEVRELGQESDRVVLRLGSRQSVSEAVGELRDRIDAVARQV